MKQYDEQYKVCPHCGYKSGAEPINPLYLPEGTVLDGRYLVGTVIGQGGFGITYIAFDQSIERKVAIKEYFPYGLSTRTSESPTVMPMTTQDAGENYRFGKEKFIEEARTLARFSKMDSIVTVLTCFSENNTAYFVMEYLEGEDLLHYVQNKGGKLSWNETLGLLEPVFDALEAIHSQGLIHRDISPDNIFVTKDGKTKLLDFGTARFAMSEKSKSLSVILKPGYAPPEQYSSRGNQGPWTDVYALAATIYRLITGQAPFDAVDRQMGTSMDIAIELGGNVPYAAKQALHRALELEPMNRPSNILAFRQALGREAKPLYGNGYASNVREAVPNSNILNITGKDFIIDEDFDDDSLEDEIRVLFDDKEYIFERDMANLKSFEAPGRSIKSIWILTYAKNLESINLSENMIKDIYAVEELINLRHIDMSSNNIRDIWALGNLTELEYLNLNDNKVCDIEPLGELAKITYLDLSGNKIKNAEVLYRLRNLRELYLDFSGIKNITFIEEMKNLEVLSLYGNSISDFSVLTGLQTLRSLDIGQNKCVDLEILTKLPNLKYLCLDNFGIDQMEIFLCLTSLEGLVLGYNNIREIRALSEFTKIKELDLSSNLIEDCTALSGLRNLEKLDLRGNRLKDISSLSDLPNLKCLFLGGNPIRDYSPVNRYYDQLVDRDF